jgi:hypothetical protein
VYEPMMIVVVLSEDAALTRSSQYWPSRSLSHTHALSVHRPLPEHSWPSLMQSCRLLAATPSHVKALSWLSSRFWR